MGSVFFVLEKLGKMCEKKHKKTNKKMPDFWAFFLCKKSLYIHCKPQNSGLFHCQEI